MNMIRSTKQVEIYLQNQKDKPHESYYLERKKNVGLAAKKMR